MNEIKLQGDGWLLSVKIDSTITSEVKKKVYAFIQEMLEYMPSLNPIPHPPMTNKTAIDILIEDLLTGKLVEVLSNKERYKEIERQQLSKAFDEGADRIIPIEGSQYYEQTFGNSQNTQQ